MAIGEKKKSPSRKSPSRSKKALISRRSRSRTRKTNQYLLVGRENSLSQTRLASNGHINGSIPRQHSAARISRPRKRSRVPRTESQSATTIQLDMLSVVLFCLALLLRIWNIGSPGSIVFDEQISGAQITSYYRREMYFSLDPPLSTQVYTAAGYLYGAYPTEFEFKEVGAEYSTEVPYVIWRVISATTGALLVSTVYDLMRATDAHITACFISSLLVAADPALIVQSRIFSADNLAVTMSMLSLTSAVRYTKEENSRFSALRWLLAAGLLSGISLSMKYSAAFTYLLVIYLVTSRLWTNIADGLYSSKVLWRRAVLILVSTFLLPVCVYIASWGVHVVWLNRAGPQAASYNSLSSALQLREAQFVPQAISNGSIVTLRHVHGKSCWLHSHDLLYPKRYVDGRGSSHQQQVTCYPFADVNNKWTVVKLNTHAGSGEFALLSTEEEKIIRHGDTISLIHETTGRLLNSHNVAAPLSPSKQEVSCFIDYNISMPLQAVWVLEVDNRDEDVDQWLARRSEIKLIHVNSSAAISVTSKQLPDWGRGQYELVADPFTFHENALWVADDLVAAEDSMYNYSSSDVMNVTVRSTLHKVYEIHKRIFLNFYEYKEEHQYSSSPLDWPLGQQNLLYWVSAHADAQIYMLPNIVSWIVSLLCLESLCIWYLLIPVVSRSSSITLLSDEHTGLSRQLLICLGGYALNMLPYFLTDAPLLLYNYLPALVFCHMSLGYAYSQAVKQMGRFCQRLLVHVMYLALMLSSLAVTYCLLPLVYGTGEGQHSLVTQLQSFTAWKFLREQGD